MGECDRCTTELQLSAYPAADGLCKLCRERATTPDWAIIGALSLLGVLLVLVGTKVGNGTG